jgi:hypothetical protein
MQLPQPPVAGDDLRRDAQLIIPTDRFLLVAICLASVSAWGLVKVFSTPRNS